MKNNTKRTYSLLSNVFYAMKKQWRMKRSTLIICALGVIAGVGLPFIGIMLPKLVIDELTVGATIGRFVSVVGGASLALIVLNYVKSYAEVIYGLSIGSIAVMSSVKDSMHKMLHMDYEVMEHPDTKALYDKAMNAGASNHTPAHNMVRSLTRLLISVIGFILYGGVIAAVHPLIVLLLAVSAVIGWAFMSWSRKYAYATREVRSEIYGKLNSLRKKAMNPAAAKDIRLYTMSGWIRDLMAQLHTQGEKAEDDVAVRNMATHMVDGLLILLRDGAAYAFLIMLLLREQIALGDFVFVFAAIGALAGWVSDIMLQANELMRGSNEMCDIRAYYDLPDKMNTGAGAPLPSGKGLPPGIELRGMSYSYPKAEKPTLTDINLSIKPGERIAIVGANGAGKTTLVKLISGLYLPTQGEVLLNGISTTEYNRDEYYSLFSAVFQDIHLLTCDIAGNISQQPPEETDYARVAECLRLSGLDKAIEALPQKEKTMLVRQVNDDAVEFSGGEKQKLALARALYKNAPVIILDEPTAALDPIAESEIYQRYSELTKGTTSIYISHRLASTRFCDRILFIDDNRIAEMGTHDELMRLNGKYANMFEIQAHYYKTGKEAQQDVG